jgi:drug/metabolite transporter (DMT)-like permease
VLSVLLLGQTITLNLWLGGGLILAGVLLSLSRAAVPAQRKLNKPTEVMTM